MFFLRLSQIKYSLSNKSGEIWDGDRGYSGNGYIINNPELTVIKRQILSGMMFK